MLATARNQNGSLETFQIHNGVLRHCFQQKGGVWSAWENFPGTGWKSVSVDVNTNGKMEVFVTDVNDGVYHSWQTVAGGGPWEPWHALH